MDDRISVRLTGPAKIGAKWHKPGDEVPVDPETARDLAKAGVIDSDGGTAAADLAPGMPGYDEAVAAMAKVLADAAVIAAVEAATVELIAERDAALDRLISADAEIVKARARIAELEAQIADTGAPSGGTSAVSEAASSSEEPAAPEAAKTAKKSGAAKKD